MYELLKSVLVEELQLDEAGLRPDADLDSAGVDSLAAVELSMVLSKRYDIEVSDDDVLRAPTLADIACLMEEHRARS